MPSTCQTAVCGDGFVQAGVEECDDGNDVDVDACPNNCQVARCGDGFIWAGVEECDDANDIDTDDCRNTCAVARCGDGVIREGVEVCDDANDSDRPMPNKPSGARCGDGFVFEDVEECDDGNEVDTDGCRNECILAQCGDGVVHLESRTVTMPMRTIPTSVCRVVRTHAVAMALCAQVSRNAMTRIVEMTMDAEMIVNGPAVEMVSSVLMPADDPRFEECDDGNDRDDDACLNSC